MKLKNILCLALAFLSISLVACSNPETGSSSQVEQSSTSEGIGEFVDYASQFKYEPSARATEIVTVENHVDGDTVHFKSNNGKNGILKARFLAVDTPESTGKVQPWGYAASNFTKTELANAAEIMIESDTSDGKWNLDSTGERHMVWVWYRPAAGADFKLLNLNLMQNGYAAAKNLTSTAYCEVMNKAYTQAIAHQIRYYSKEKDPDYYYGDAIPVTLREIRTNIKEYVDKTVQFPALITRVAGQSCYVESFDGETNQIYGLPVYMGYNFTCEFIEKGNMVSWIGNIQYYETGGTYQLSNLTYMATKPNYSKNVKLISEGNEVVATPITSADLETKGEILSGANVSIENLKVTSIYTTDNGGDNDGAMTLTCKDASNKTVNVRTSVIYKEDGSLVVEADLLNKTISIESGTVEYYKDREVYQVHVFTFKDIVIK